MIDPKILFGLAAASCLTLAACADDETDPNEPGEGMASLALTFDGLEPLGADYVYEGWIIVDGAPVTTGRFTEITGTQTFEVAQATPTLPPPLY